MTYNVSSGTLSLYSTLPLLLKSDTLVHYGHRD